MSNTHDSFQLRNAAFTIDNQRNGLETQAKTNADIRDTLYFEPCNITFNPYQDFVFTYFKLTTEMSMQLSTFQTFSAG